MPSGYVRIFDPAHELANKDGYVLEHRKVAFDAGFDPRGHHVHHLNGDRRDNRIENLEIKTPGDHHRDHIAEAGFVENQYGIWPLRKK